MFTASLTRVISLHVTVLLHCRYFSCHILRDLVSVDAVVLKLFDANIVFACAFDHASRNITQTSVFPSLAALHVALIATAVPQRRTLL
jgi:hypothetical protein